ncbi:MAG: type II secretion system protein [bacterium]|nr:type II secretion system protein [bacterium]
MAIIPTSNNPRPYSRGYSLLEFLCSLAVFSILMFISLPSLANVSNNTLSPEGLEIVLNNLRLKSQLNRQIITLKFLPGAGSIAVTSSNDDNEPSLQLPRGSRVDESRFGNTAGDYHLLTYYPGRTASPGSAEITWNESKTCRLTQSLRGETIIECP